MESVTSLVDGIHIGKQQGADGAEEGKRNQYREAVVWRVFRYKILFRMILDQLYDDELFGRRVFTKYGSSDNYFERIRKYHQIVEVDWMIKNNYLWVLKDKLKRGEYINMSYYDASVDGGMKGMGTVCTLQDTELFNTIYSRYQDAFIWDGLLEWAAIGGNPSIMDTLINQTTPTKLYHREDTQVQLWNCKLYSLALQHGNIKVIDYFLQNNINIEWNNTVDTRFRPKYADLQVKEKIRHYEIMFEKGDIEYYNIINNVTLYPIKIPVFIDSITIDQLIDFTTKVPNYKFSIELFTSILKELCTELQFIIKTPSKISRLLEKIQYLYLKTKGLVDDPKRNEFNTEAIDKLTQQVYSFQLSSELDSILDLLVYLKSQNIYSKDQQQIYSYIGKLISVDLVKEKPELIEFINSKLLKTTILYDYLSIDHLIVLNNNNVTTVKSYQYTPTSQQLLLELEKLGWGIVYNNSLYQAIQNLDIDYVKVILNSKHLESSKKNEYISSKQMEQNLIRVSNPKYKPSTALNQQQQGEEQIEETKLNIFKFVMSKSPTTLISTRREFWKDILWSRKWVEYFISACPKLSPIGYNQDPNKIAVPIRIYNIFDMDDLGSFKLLVEWFKGTLNFIKSVLNEYKIVLRGKIMRYMFEKYDGLLNYIKLVKYWEMGLVDETKYIHQQMVSRNLKITYERSIFMLVGNTGTMSWVKMVLQNETSETYYGTMLYYFCQLGNLQQLKEFMKEYNISLLKSYGVVSYAMDSPHVHIIKEIIDWYNESPTLINIGYYFQNQMRYKSIYLANLMIEYLSDKLPHSLPTCKSILTRLKSSEASPPYFHSYRIRKIEELINSHSSNETINNK